MRSTSDSIFSHDDLSRDADVTNADLFSDLVATQVLDDNDKVRTLGEFKSCDSNPSKGKLSLDGQDRIFS